MPVTQVVKATNSLQSHRAHTCSAIPTQVSILKISCNVCLEQTCPETPCSSTIAAVHHMASNPVFSEEEQVPKTLLDQAHRRIAELEEQLEQLGRQLSTSQQTSTALNRRLSTEVNTQREVQSRPTKHSTNTACIPALGLSIGLHLIHGQQTGPSH